MIVERMSQALLLPENYIARLAKTASYQYKRYEIDKRGGGIRVIWHPSRRLKPLQKWILSNVLETWPVHSAAMAYRKGFSILDNAKRHVGNAYLLRMDMKDFFPSLTANDLVNYRATRPHLFRDWSDQDFAWVSSLIFREGQLTIGAPTSPIVSNAFCFDVDVQLDGISQSMGVTYTRYADDLFFSTNAKGVLTQLENKVPTVLHEAKLPENLSINTTKTRHSSKKGARRVTGIVLGSDGQTHVGRDLKRAVRAQVHKWDSLNPAQRTRLAGSISYITGVEPDFVNALVKKYGHAEAMRARYGRP